MTRRILGVAFKYGIGIALLAYVVWRNWSPPPGSSAPGLAEALQRPIQVVPLVAAMLICLVSVLVTFLRWYVLVRAQDLPFTVLNSIRLGLIGYFLSTFLPGSVGGDIIKAAFIAREQSRRTVAVATVIMDRAVGLWGLFWLVALVGGAFWIGGDPAIESEPYLRTIVLGSWGIALGTLLFWLLLGVLPDPWATRLAGSLERIPKVGGSLAELWRAVWMYRRRGGSLALALLMAVVGHVGFVLVFYFAAQVLLGPDQESQLPSLVQHFLIVPVGMTLQALFPSPGGIGGGEAAFGWVYTLAGKPEMVGVLGSLMQRVVNWSLGLVGYLVYLRMRPALRVLTDTGTEELAA